MLFGVELPEELGRVTPERGERVPTAEESLRPMLAPARRKSQARESSSAPPMHMAWLEMTIGFSIFSISSNRRNVPWLRSRRIQLRARIGLPAKSPS